MGRLKPCTDFIRFFYLLFNRDRQSRRQAKTDVNSPSQAFIKHAITRPNRRFHRRNHIANHIFRRIMQQRGQAPFYGGRWLNQ
ncbi:MAG TPA: hypothetical protein DD729_09685 [Rhodobacteraceae bacterium]|nr:hypothetical protein [Paracoccaceae bacterium]